MPETKIGNAPYMMWYLHMPFAKNGVPVSGTFGSSSDDVIIMKRETFLRLIAEHPSLGSAEFTIEQRDV